MLEKSMKNGLNMSNREFENIKRAAVNLRYHGVGTTKNDMIEFANVNVKTTTNILVIFFIIFAFVMLYASYQIGASGVLQ